MVKLTGTKIAAVRERVTFGNGANPVSPLAEAEAKVY